MFETLPRCEPPDTTSRPVFQLKITVSTESQKVIAVILLRDYALYARTVTIFSSRLDGCLLGHRNVNPPCMSVTVSGAIQDSVCGNDARFDTQPLR